MSKCVNCLKEINEKEVFCLTCHEEVLGCAKNQIANLEAKLAESEKQIKDARETGNMAVDSWCKNRRKYEAQIAEMQNKSFILYSMLYETLEKQGCENVASQIDQMTGWTYDKEAYWLKGNRNYDQLKQQLAEKEKEMSIKSIIRTLVKYNNLNCTFRDKTNSQIQQCGDVYNSNYGYFNFEDDYDECLNNRNDSRFDIISIDLDNQDKISFCIEQLEKVKELLNTDFESAISWIDSYEDGEYLNSITYNHNNTIKIIDNQIKQLKEKNNG